MHLEKGKERWYSTERTNPDHKSIMNKYGKEVLFTPGMIELTNNKGMNIRIIDGVGIEIFSDKKISIISMGKIKIQSEKKDILVVASESINLRQNGTSVTLEKNLILGGAQTNIQ